MLQTLFTPRAGSSKPRLSTHNTPHRALPLKPPKPPRPRRRLCLTARKPGRLHLRHMQVRRHRHPVTARKIHPRRRLATCKPRRDAIPTRHTRPTTTPTCHAQAPLWRHPNTERKAPPLPTSRDANTAHRTPPPRRNANTSHRTPPPLHPQHGMQNGAAVGMVAVVDSGMAAVGMAVTARHSYLRLYIFYLCNKLILFLYFVIKANNILLLLSITDVKCNNNK